MLKTTKDINKAFLKSTTHLDLQFPRTLDSDKKLYLLKSYYVFSIVIIIQGLKCKLIKKQSFTPEWTELP